MPISLELFNFTEAFHIQLVKDIAESFVRLGKWLDARLKQAQAADRATADVPIVWIRDAAVSAWIDERQWRTLAPAVPDPGLGAHLARGARTFVGALGAVVSGGDVAQEKLLPNLLSAMVAALDRVVASLERFARPSAGMFDVTKRTASDIFGEAALGWRAILSSRAQLIGEGTPLGGFAGTLAALAAPAAAGGAEAGAVSIGPSGGASLGTTLEAVGRGLVAAVALLPFLPRYVGALWAELSVFLRARVLEILVDVEKQALGLRRTVIDLFEVDLRAALRAGLGYAISGRDMVAAMVALFVEATEGWANEFVSGLQTWFKDLVAYVDAMVEVFHSLRTVLDHLLQVDLIEGVLGGRSWWGLVKDLAAPPPLLVGDFGDPASRAAAADRLQKWLTFIREQAKSLLGPLGDLADLAEIKLGDVREIIDILLRTKTDEIAETSAFHDLALPGMPDLSDQFTAGLAQVRASLSGRIGMLQARVAAAADTASTLFDALGTRFGRAAQAELHASSRERLTGIATHAADLAEAAFPPDQGEGVSDAVARIARGFEKQLTLPHGAWRAGFEIVAVAIRRYVLAMRAYWLELRAADDARATGGPGDALPTSPHKLAHRRRIAAIEVPRLSIAARGRPLDRGLIEEVVAAFARAVGDAHRQAVATAGAAGG